MQSSNHAPGTQDPIKCPITTKEKDPHPPRNISNNTKILYAEWNENTNIQLHLNGNDKTLLYQAVIQQLTYYGNTVIHICISVSYSVR